MVSRVRTTSSAKGGSRTLHRCPLSFPFFPLLPPSSFFPLPPMFFFFILYLFFSVQGVCEHPVTHPLHLTRPPRLDEDAVPARVDEPVPRRLREVGGAAADEDLLPTVVGLRLVWQCRQIKVASSGGGGVLGTPVS